MHVAVIECHREVRNDDQERDGPDFGAAIRELAAQGCDRRHPQGDRGGIQEMPHPGGDQVGGNRQRREREDEDRQIAIVHHHTTTEVRCVEIGSATQQRSTCGVVDGKVREVANEHHPQRGDQDDGRGDELRAMCPELRRRTCTEQRRGIHACLA